MTVPSLHAAGFSRFCNLSTNLNNFLYIYLLSFFLFIERNRSKAEDICSYSYRYHR